jgi:hypothetical protein
MRRRRRVAPVRELSRRRPWWRKGCRADAVTAPGLAGPDVGNAVFKLKDALLRRRFTDKQIQVAYLT